ncbi:hypothetical protein [uncultured Kordia sp.]|uniref:hypothetical protein n=1 Tax=uncultured Kordia sp. TaxID=507699 RepID=UPI0026082F05|nr:hypothetical protein [uncultured Kordia sp.]
MSVVFPKFHLGLFKEQSRKELFFEDEDLLIMIEYDFDASDNIDSIEFSLKSKNQRTYSIINVNPCYDQFKVNVIYYVIHFLVEDDNPNIENSFTAKNPTHIPDINLTSDDKRGLAIFRFSFHTNPNYDDPCSISEEQPETKDGAIIVSI